MTRSRKHDTNMIKCKNTIMHTQSVVREWGVLGQASTRVLSKYLRTAWAGQAFSQRTLDLLLTKLTRTLSVLLISEQLGYIYPQNPQNRISANNKPSKVKFLLKKFSSIFRLLYTYPEVFRPPESDYDHINQPKCLNTN